MELMNAGITKELDGFILHVNSRERDEKRRKRACVREMEKYGEG